MAPWLVGSVVAALVFVHVAIGWIVMQWLIPSEALGEFSARVGPTGVLVLWGSIAVLAGWVAARRVGEPLHES